MLLDLRMTRQGTISGWSLGEHAQRSTFNRDDSFETADER
jgi:hypothetical protein